MVLQLPMTGGSTSKSLSTICMEGDQNFCDRTYLYKSWVIAYLVCHVTSVLESDWHALYSAWRHGPYTLLTRPLLAFCVRGGWLARLSRTLQSFIQTHGFQAKKSRMALGEKVYLILPRIYFFNCGH